MPASVTIVVVSWNTRDLLARCLRSIAPEVDSGRAEVTVVDNASEDGSPELVRESYPWASLLALRENRGFGAAVNLAAARTTSHWIAAANADVELLPGALEALLAAGEEDARAAALGPRLLLPDGSAQHSVYSFPTVPFTLVFNLGIPRLSPGLADSLCLEGRWDPARPRRVDWAIGAFLLLRRPAFDEVGGFPEEHWMYAEDLDLGWRLARSGWHTRYVPEAVVRHEAGAATRRLWGEERTRQWMTSTYAWMARRRGLLITRLVALINVVGAAARWALLRAGALIRPRRFAQPCAEMRRWARLHMIGLRSSEALVRHR
jgi:N-acetylglucosaminyl-diphospho-decaprenol L-rhamnosyltransferase